MSYAALGRCADDWNRRSRHQAEIRRPLSAGVLHIRYASGFVDLGRARGTCGGIFLLTCLSRTALHVRCGACTYSYVRQQVGYVLLT